MPSTTTLPLKKEFISVRVVNPTIHSTYMQRRYVTYEIIFKTNSLAFSLKHSIVRRRCSDFKWLRRILARTCDGKPPSLPMGKCFFGTFTDEYLKKRQQVLTDFMKRVVNDPNYMSHPALHLFIFTEMETVDMEKTVLACKHDVIADAIASASNMYGIHHDKLSRLSCASSNSVSARSLPNITKTTSKNGRKSSENFATSARSEPSRLSSGVVSSVGSFLSSNTLYRQPGNSLRTREEVNTSEDEDWVIVKRVPILKRASSPSPFEREDSCSITGKTIEKGEYTKASWVLEDVDDVTVQGHMSQFLSFQKFPAISPRKHSDIGPFRLQNESDVAQEYHRRKMEKESPHPALSQFITARSSANSSQQDVSDERSLFNSPSTSSNNTGLREEKPTHAVLGQKQPSPASSNDSLYNGFILGSCPLIRPTQFSVIPKISLTFPEDNQDFENSFSSVDDKNETELLENFSGFGNAISKPESSDEQLNMNAKERENLPSHHTDVVATKPSELVPCSSAQQEEAHTKTEIDFVTEQLAETYQQKEIQIPTTDEGITKSLTDLRETKQEIPKPDVVTQTSPRGEPPSSSDDSVCPFSGEVDPESVQTSKFANVYAPTHSNGEQPRVTYKLASDIKASSVDSKTLPTLDSAVVSSGDNSPINIGDEIPPCNNNEIGQVRKLLQTSFVPISQKVQGMEGAPLAKVVNTKAQELFPFI